MGEVLSALGTPSRIALSPDSRGQLTRADYDALHISIFFRRAAFPRLTAEEKMLYLIMYMGQPAAVNGYAIGIVVALVLGTALVTSRKLPLAGRATGRNAWRYWLFFAGKTLAVLAGLAALWIEANSAIRLRVDNTALRDVVGGRSGAYEKKMTEARETAIGEMIERAGALGADAVVGVDIDYETVGNGMMMVSASGTAVRTG